MSRFARKLFRENKEKHRKKHSIERGFLVDFNKLKEAMRKEPEV